MPLCVDETVRGPEMGDELDKFYEHLKRGPAMLFLGQRHLALNLVKTLFFPRSLENMEAVETESSAITKSSKVRRGKRPQ